jgi:ketosteroid isomerase-like protein
MSFRIDSPGIALVPKEVPHLNKEESMSALTSSDEQSIRHFLEEVWTDCCLRGDWDGALEILSDDFVYMTPDLPAFRGKAEIRGYMEGLPPISHMRQSMKVLTGSTELAVAQCTWELALDVEGTQMSGIGKSLITATRMNGEWVFTASCYNFDAPLAAKD